MKPLIILQILEKNKKSGIGAEDDVMYLGDPENDNLAFRKAGIPMRIYSDARLDPKLDCSYFMDQEQLSSFKRLRNNEYLLNKELLRDETSVMSKPARELGNNKSIEFIRISCI